MPRSARAERWREWLQETAAAAGSLLLAAVFVGGVVWSVSRQDERGPVAQVIAGVLLVVIALLAVGAAFIGVAFLVTIGQTALAGTFEAHLFAQLVVLLFAGLCVAGLLAVAWLLLMVV
ncbi:MAG: hypothetical protein ACRD2T_12665 [Thermoanaerobaculia bacterium]